MAKHTKPQLRERIKEDIKTSDRGGRKGRWSATDAKKRDGAEQPVSSITILG